MARSHMQALRQPCLTPGRGFRRRAGSVSLPARARSAAGTGQGQAPLRERHGRAETLRRARRHGVARATGLVHVAQPLPETPDLLADLLRRLAVALAAARKPVEAQRLAPGDRGGGEVAELPV